MSGAVIEPSDVNSLFCEHRDRLLRYLLQRVRCPDTAEDLSQEAYLRLLRQQTVPHAGNLTAYLLHNGEALAMPGRLLVLAAGLSCPLLWLTGTRRWLQKRRSQRRHPAKS